MRTREQLELRQAAMKARLHAERLAPARRARSILECNTRARTARNPAAEVQVRKPKNDPELAAWLASQAQRRQEGYAFREMGRKITREGRALERERYVTAMYGCKTSWARILDHAKYAVCSETFYRF